MASQIFTIRENSDRELDFTLTREDQEYLQSELFNKGKLNIDVHYSREQKPTIRVGPFAGIVQLTNRRIHFSTKVDVRLFYMLSFLKSEKEFLYDPETLIEIREGTNFFDIIGRFFLNYVNDILKKGLLKKYVRREENLRFLRGKILIKNQSKANVVDKSKFYCEYENLTFDNLENQIVLSALLSLIALIRFNDGIKNELRKLETILRDFITLVDMEPQACSLVRFSRINQHYEHLIKLSRLILEERFIRSIYKGESKGFNFIVNMNRVYEDFITEIVGEIISQDSDFESFEIETQPRFNSLVRERTIVTKPDVVVRNESGEYPFIIDAKYKREDSNTDYYQVIAYSLALRDSKACCLIYPKSEEETISEEPLTLVRDLTSEEPDIVSLHSKTVDLYIGDKEIPSFKEFTERVKSQVKNILLEVFYPKSEI